MHTALHGLLLFNTRKEAEVALKTFNANMKDLESCQEKGEFENNEFNYEFVYQEYVGELVNEAVDVIHELNFHEIYTKKFYGRVQYIYDDENIIVNKFDVIDLYL
jgi:hypothetical protein